MPKKRVNPWTPVATTLSREHQTLDPGTVSSVRNLMFPETCHLALHGGEGTLRTDLVRLPVLGLAVGRVDSTGHDVVLREAENITFLLPTYGRLDIRVGQVAYRVRTGQFMALRPTERLTRATPMRGGRFQAFTLHLPMSRVQALAENEGLQSAAILARDGNFLTGPVGRWLAGSLAQLGNDLILRRSLQLPVRVCAAIGHLIDEQILEILGATIPAGGIGPGHSYRRVLAALHRVREAEDILHAHSEEALSMQDVARRLGVSLRSLQLAFLDVHGCGPREMLNTIRLENARARLLEGRRDMQVTTVALDAGFSHLGRFSQAYARAYGERPSETLARRRA